MLVALLTTGLGLWWWVLNVVRHGELQPKGGVSFPAADVIPPLTQWVHDFSFTFMRTLWIAVGWNEGTRRCGCTPRRRPCSRYCSWAARGHCDGRRVVLLMHLAWLGPLAIVVSGSVGEFFYSGTTRAAQGRYVQTAVVAFAVLVAAALARYGCLLTWVPLVTMLSAIAGTAYGLHHFWAPAAGQHPWLGRLENRRQLAARWTGHARRCARGRRPRRNHRLPRSCERCPMSIRTSPTGRPAAPIRWLLPPARGGRQRRAVRRESRRADRPRVRQDAGTRRKEAP
jgi:hypothetical protein